jgi:endonuclease-3
MEYPIDTVIGILRTVTEQWKAPAVTEMSRKGADPFIVLISTILSLRTKDEVTGEASKRLFRLADTPGRMRHIPAGEIEKAIFPVGFWRNKARTIIDVSSTIEDKYNGKVPDNIDELLKLRGVGRKTANLVMTLGWGLPGICVDTHVHRIVNRWEYVSTKTPEETEFALRDKLPTQYWIEINDILVSFGRNMCKPISPICTQCPVYCHCRRIGVKTHR